MNLDEISFGILPKAVAYLIRDLADSSHSLCPFSIDFQKNF